MDDLLKNVETDDEALLVVRKHITSETHVSKLFGLDDIKHIQRQIAPEASYKYAYILLDTNNAAPELTDEFRFGWRLVNYISPQTGTISTINDIRDLVGMRIFPVKMDLIQPVGEADKNYINTVTNINNNFTILIHEFQSQAFVGRDNRKFHFSLFPVLMNPVDVGAGAISPPNPYYEFTTSGKGNGWFWFNQPITEFSTITISIGNPFDLVKPGANNTRTLIPLQLIYLSENKNN